MGPEGRPTTFPGRLSGGGAEDIIKINTPDLELVEKISSCRSLEDNLISVSAVKFSVNFQRIADRLHISAVTCALDTRVSSLQLEEKHKGLVPVIELRIHSAITS